MIPPLLGRERDRDELHRLLTGPDSVFVLLGGALGSGKTSLLTDVCQQARQAGSVVLSASCDPDDRAADGALAQQLCHPHQDVSCAHGVDEIIGLLSPPGQPDSDSEPSGSRGTRRLVVLIDDLQWADAASLKLLLHLMRAVEGLPVTVIASLGPGDAVDEPALGAVLQLFHHQPQLSPLDAAVVRRHVASMTGLPEDAPFTHACSAAIGGNHSLFRAALGALEDHRVRGPGDFSPSQALNSVLPDAALAARAVLRRTAPEAERVATVLAILGGAQAVELIAGAAAMDVHLVEDTVHLLARTELIEHADGGVHLTPPLLGTALAQSVPVSVRKDCNARAAQLLHSWGAPAERVARYLVDGPLGIPSAPDVLCRAADMALERCAPDEALVYLHRAMREGLDERMRGEILRRIATAEPASSRGPGAVKELRVSLRRAATAQEQTAAARRLASALFVSDRHAEALEVLQQTVERIRPHAPSSALRLEIDHLLAGLGEAASAVRTRPRLLDLSMAEATELSSHRPLAALLSFRGAVLGDSASDVVERARRALSRGMAPTDEECVLYACAALALGAAGRPDLTREYASSAVTETRARKSPLSHAGALAVRAHAHGMLGRLHDAEADAQAALVALQDAGTADAAESEHRRAFAVATLTESLIRQGREQEAEALLHNSGLSGSLGTHMIYDYPLLVRGRLHAARGRPGEALADMLRCGERLASRDMTVPGLYPWRSEAALMHLRLGDREQAAVLAGDELTLARAWAVPETIAVALRARGLVTGEREGMEMLTEAAALLDATSARFQYAQTQADRGVLAVRCGLTTDGRAALQEAVSAAHECGAPPVAEQALAGLRALGDRPRTPTFRGRDALTPAQRRVAELACQGMSNGEIAQQLFVGLRTVEMHLTVVYMKLGVRGRHGLAEALR
ncbi:AAA family ATPase [Streptomyces sp. NBC_00829]|uniref:helix-turn-helix transcriptional regulator n=1 Tax=Streptomyces sp. NBC_00829 TaxID=2903679 RepID=UPI00386AC259|nr:AAA family ATPase [Streptomyces sp. NBC_00829]